MNVVAVLQARMGASRFPGKVLAPVDGLPVLVRMVALVRQADPTWRIVLATTREREDDVLACWGAALGVECVRGPVEPLARFDCVAQMLKLADEDILVRVTCDDPFKSPALMAETVRRIQPGLGVTDTNHGGMEGLGCEVFTVATLRAALVSPSDEAREHVTLDMLRHHPGAKVSMDTVEDWERLCGPR